MREASKDGKRQREFYFEVGTEEAIRPFTTGELQILLHQLKARLAPATWARILYVVVQSGTNLDLGNRINTGVYNRERLAEMMKVVKKYGKWGKEHNGDYLSVEQCRDRFQAGVHGLNVAPAFGQLETEIILERLRESGRQDLFERFYQLVYTKASWQKWAVKIAGGFDPLVDKAKLCLIGGHYVLSTPEWKEIKFELENSMPRMRKELLSLGGDEDVANNKNNDGGESRDIIREKQLSPTKMVEVPSLDQAVIEHMTQFFRPYLLMAQAMQGTIDGEVLASDMHNYAGGLSIAAYGGGDEEGVDIESSVLKYAFQSATAPRNQPLTGMAGMSPLKPQRIIFSDIGGPYLYEAHLFALPSTGGVGKQRFAVDYLREFTVFFKPDSDKAMGVPLVQGSPKAQEAACAAKNAKAAGSSTSSSGTAVTLLDPRLRLEVILTPQPDVAVAFSPTDGGEETALHPKTLYLAPGAVVDVRGYTMQCRMVLLSADGTLMSDTDAGASDSEYDKVDVDSEFSSEYVAQAVGGDVRGAFVLVAGVGREQAPGSDLFVKHTPMDKIKKVFKPWGHELWLTMCNETYCIKEIMLKVLLEHSFFLQLGLGSPRS